MSGVLSALAATGTIQTYSVTVAEIAISGVFGYNPNASPTGAISSTAFRSTTINNVSARTPAAGSENDIQLVLDGDLTQSYFAELIVQSTAGAVRRYSTADATFGVSGGTLSSWTWDNDDPAWTATGTRFLLLRF